jgi:hypothetical protein
MLQMRGFAQVFVNQTHRIFEVLSQGSLDFVDMDAVSNTVRFYHAIPRLNPPTQ